MSGIHARVAPGRNGALRNAAGVALRRGITLDPMKPMRVYIDTSVVGGCFDAKFRDASLRLFERFRTGQMIAVVSDLTVSELDRAPSAVRSILEGIPLAYREEARVTSEAAMLASRYIDAGVIGRAMLGDAEHIATATIYRVDALVSWNFKHIVNVRRIHGYNRVNALAGHPFVWIRTPAEVISDG